MKKIMVLVALVAFAAGVMLVCSDLAVAAAKDKPKEAAVAPAAKAPAVAAPEGKVVCKFKDNDQMKEFEQLYVAKQATFGRMSVLQAYFSLEQNNLQEIDKQMEKKFDLKMDPSKMYDLNRDGLEIREVGDIPKQPAPAAQQ